ncbi:hypothetical protein, partial [Methanobrevibacter cuticularis]|uniref:hypothetical protein n=1 Tax=Methanobrevibacter cuticularis TaxID=47311 RepID=UPI001B80C90E
LKNKLDEILTHEQLKITTIIEKLENNKSTNQNHNEYYLKSCFPHKNKKNDYKRLKKICRKA